MISLEKTGLPVLPEGFHWSITSHESGVWTDNPYDVYVLHIRNLIEGFGARSTVSANLKDPVVEARKEELEKLAEKARNTASLNHRRYVGATLFEDLWHSKMVKAQTKRDVFEKELAALQVSPVALTTEIVQAAAVELMEKFEALQEAERLKDEKERRMAESKAMSDAFVGDYPPKSLLALKVGKESAL